MQISIDLAHIERLGFGQRTRYRERILVERRLNADDPNQDRAWTITDGCACYNRFGEWEFEPRPSSRDEEFFARTRYGFDEAVALAEKLAASETGQIT